MKSKQLKITYYFKKDNKNVNKEIKKKYIQNGKALYLLGIDDDGQIVGMTPQEMEFTLNHLKSIVKKIDAKIKMIRAYNGGKGYVCSARIFLPDNILKEKTSKLLIY